MKALEKYDNAVRSYLRNGEMDGMSQQTVRNYKNTLGYFREFWAVSHSGEPESDPTVQDMLDWKESLLSGGAKTSTVRQYLVRMGAFFNLLSDPTLGDAQVYATNPVSKRLLPNTRKEEKRPYDILLTDQQVAKLWRNECCSNSRQDLWPRNYAITILLLTTEIRNSELLALTPNDIDWGEGIIYIERGKGNKFREVDFPEIAQVALKMYFDSGIRPATARNDEPVFGTLADSTGHRSDSKAWKKGTSQWLSGVVERHVKAVTGVSNIRTHDLRHIGARLDLNSGMRFEELQAKLGHESVTTTQIYSGKLMARRNRESTRKVLEERDRQCAKMEAMYA